MRKADAGTIERWKTQPRLTALEYFDRIEPAPPLWKDLTLASIVAALLWGAAALAFG